MPVKQGIRRHLSFKNKSTANPNYEPSGVTSNVDSNENDSIIPLLPKDARKAAVKMAKGMIVYSLNFSVILFHFHSHSHPFHTQH